MLDLEYILPVISVLTLAVSITFILWFIKTLNYIKVLLAQMRDYNEWTYNLIVNINKHVNKNNIENRDKKTFNDNFFVTEDLTPDFETFTKVVGVTQTNENREDIQTLLKQIAPNEHLDFKSDPTEHNIPNLVKVYAKGFHIGYLNKELSGNITYFLKNNPEFVLIGEIVEITGGFGKNKGCNIKIMFKKRY